MIEFMRGPIWSSTAERVEWEPRLRAANDAVLQLESLSVSAGLRPAALFSVSVGELPTMARLASTMGLVTTPLSVTRLGGTYSATVPETGAPGLRVAMHVPEVRSETWHAAWETGDEDAIGTWLGYPACCRAFFRRVWVAERRRDTTLAMAGGPDGRWYSNILLRWLGIRMAFHLPCSFNCPETVAWGESLEALARKSGLGQQMDIVRELLEQPMTYSAMHGIGMVTTPHFRFQFSTDYTPAEVKLERRGEEHRPKAVALPCPKPEGRPEDNGFSSAEAMNGCHDAIVRVVTERGIVRPRILDLGCGDGTLLARFPKSDKGPHVGYELDADRAMRALALHDPAHVRVLAGEISEVVPARATVGHPDVIEFDVALIMPGRLLEMTKVQAAAVLGNLPLVAKTIVAYAYGDWLTWDGRGSNPPHWKASHDTSLDAIQKAEGRGLERLCNATGFVMDRGASWSDTTVPVSVEAAFVHLRLDPGGLEGLNGSQVS